MTTTRSIPLVLFLLSACGLRGSGTPATQTRELDGFQKIDLGGAFELVVHVDPAAPQKVEVTADDNIVEHVETTVADGELDVRMDDVGAIRPKTAMRVEVWVPALAAINGSGASDIDVEGLHGETFTLAISGTSDTTLQGTVERFEVNISGAGELNAKGLKASDVELKLSGAGDATVTVEDSLDVKISGAGEVTYFGEPSMLFKEISGAGSLEKGG